MKRSIGFAAAVVLTLFVGRVFADEMKMDKKMPGKTVKFEVVDVACYVKEGAKGVDHKACAVKCVTGGGELALLNNGKLYIPVDADFHSAREQFVSKAGEKVEVSGEKISKGGINYFKIVDDTKGGGM